MVDKAESLVKTSGIHQVRVRHYGKLARIEVPIGQISRLVDEKNRSVLVEKLRDVGYAHITLDLEGYRSGSMNLDLPTKRKRS